MNKRYAVVAGVNDYPGTGLDLSGCVNDALDVSSVLRDAGYSVQVMLDSQATKSNIVNSLKDVITKASWGDRIVYHYSGHGTWKPDQDGDEVDGRDEAQCLYDFQSNGLLTDDELHLLFSATRRGVGALILSDSCHSGTMNRFANLAPAAGHPEDKPSLPKFMPPNLFTDISLERAVAIEENIARTAPRQTTSLISGSKDDEYSYDAWFWNGDHWRPNGAFSRAAVDAYHPGISLKTWYQGIASRLPTTQHPQSPQLTVASRYRAYTKAL